MNDYHRDFLQFAQRPPLTKLHVVEHEFYNEQGDRVFIKGATDFQLFKLFLEGQPIDHLLAQRAAAGANCVRVLGMMHYIIRFYPQDYWNYYGSLAAFCAKVASYGMYVYFTIFADTQVIMSGSSQQLNHYNAVISALYGVPNVFIELVNEPYAHDNRTNNPWMFPKPVGLIFLGGSYNDELGDGLRPVPPEDAHDYHTPRDGHYGGFKTFADQNMTAHPEYRKRGKPVLSGEPQKFANQDDPRRGNSTLWDPKDARKMAGSARGTAAGIFYHTPSGVFGTEWYGTEVSCADAFFRELDGA